MGDRFLIKEILRLAVGLVGISLVGCIVTDMLKQWQVVRTTFAPVWIIVPLNLLFIMKELVNSAYIRNHRRVSRKVIKNMEKTVRTLLLIIGIIMLISLPFVWFGAIEATIDGSSAGRF